MDEDSDNEPLDEEALESENQQVKEEILVDELNDFSLAKTESDKKKFIGVKKRKLANSTGDSQVCIFSNSFFFYSICHR